MVADYPVEKARSLRDVERENTISNAVITNHIKIMKTFGFIEKRKTEVY